MTGPTFRRQYGSGHSYTLDGIPKIKGVTTMMRGLKGPPESYFTETTAGYAVDHWDELAALPPSERLKEIASATKKRFTAAGARGTEVHKLAERLARGDQVEVPDHIRGHVEACVQFMDDYQLEVDLTEPALFSRKHQYAGSADLFGTVVKPMTSQRIAILGDWKTSASGPWGSMAFQLAGYRYADFYKPNGHAADPEVPVPDVDECWIIWLRADGYDVSPMEVTPAVHRQLLYIDQCRLADEECRNYKHDSLPHPETVRKVRLEDVKEES
jgi:hypothetical protein